MSAEADTLNVLALLKSSKKYSDLQLLCEGQEFSVHKSVVCIQSTVLAAACDGSFQEAATGKITIEEFDAKTVEQMIAFFYEKDYHDSIDELALEEPVQDQTKAAELNHFALMQIDPSRVAKSARTRGTLLQHVRVNAIADYYDVSELKRLANVKIRRILEDSWFADGFSTVIQLVFNITSDKALRGLIVLTTARHIEELLELEAFLALKLTSDFFLDVMCKTKSIQKAKDSSLDSKFQELESQLRDRESQLESEKDDRLAMESRYCFEKDRADRIFEKFEDCRKVLRAHSTCRIVGCDAEFRCYIKRTGLRRNPTYALRCEKCHSVHRL